MNSSLTENIMKLDLEEIIETRWERFQKEKDEYIPLDEI